MPRISGIPDPHFNWGSELVPMNARGSGKNAPEAEPSRLDSSYVHYNDYYLSELSQQVIIRCGPKAVHVEALLSAPVHVSGAASWSPFIKGLEGKIGGSGTITMADFLGRALSGTSLRQPWMSRKVWQGSEPLMLTLELKFLATGSTVIRGNVEEFIGSDASAYLEVYQPTCQLLSLLYPGGIGDNGKISNFIPPGPSAFHSFHGSDSMKGQENANGDPVGHPVDIQVGNFILFQSCFVRNCSVTYSPTLDSSGYPISATASLIIESYEYPFVDIAAASAINKRKYDEDSGRTDAIAPPFTLFKLNHQTNDMVQGIVNTLHQFANISEDSVRWLGKQLGILPDKSNKPAQSSSARPAGVKPVEPSKK